MRMKLNTEKSSHQIRGIASLVLGIGVALSIFFIILGISAFMNGSSSRYYSRSLIDMIFRSETIVFFALGVFAFIYHYVAYVMISAYATLIENSDRTDVVEALYDINETLRQKSIDTHFMAEKKNNLKQPANYADTELNKTDLDNDIELEKIDISEFNDD